MDKKLVLLPCEIYHREFDAKLILAAHLASVYGFSSLIGYDKHFNYLTPYVRSSLLLEKSCSSIMWNARIKNVLNNSGEVIVSDEEGYNNITDSNSYTWSTRLDLEAASAIDLYACWGNIDFQFFSNFPDLQPKLKILGNCRSDLLGFSGKKYYSALSSSLDNVFGPYVLCVDNFCVEHRDGAYVPPRFYKSEQENQKAQNEFALRMLDQKDRRDLFARLIRESARNNPNLNYVIRPHPCADDRWWCVNFWDLRNVYVVYKYSVDPWLHSAKALISMGCTTSIQSIIAGTPVIELMSNSLSSDQNAGYAHKYARYHVKNISELDVAIHDCMLNPSECFKNRVAIENDWSNCFNESTSAIFADQFFDLSSSNSSAFDKNISFLEQYASLRSKKSLVTSSTKWQNTPFIVLQDYTRRICKSFSLKHVQSKKVCDDLFLVSPS